MKFFVSIKPELLDGNFSVFRSIFPDNKIPVTAPVPTFDIPPIVAIANRLCPEDHLGFKLDASRLTPEQYLAMYKIFFKDRGEVELGSEFVDQCNPLRIIRVNYRHVIAVFTEEESDRI